MQKNIKLSNCNLYKKIPLLKIKTFYAYLGGKNLW